MFKPTRRWPLGLDRKTWPDRLAAVMLVLFVLIFFDVWVSQTLQAMPEVWRDPFTFVTAFGLSDWVLIPTLAIFLLAMIALRFPLGKYRRAIYELGILCGFIFVGVGLPGLITAILKRLFGRARPDIYLDSGAFQFQSIINDWTFQSVPSGHATTAIATAFVIGFIAPRFFRLVLVIAAMACVSRVVVGAHYPTDIVVGSIIGMLGAFAVRNYFVKRGWLFAYTADGSVRFRGTPSLHRLCRRLCQRAIV